MNISYTTNIHDTDAQKVKLLIQASVLAYDGLTSSSICRLANATDAPMSEYECIDGWSGVNALDGHELTIECYGLVYRSTRDPKQYIFAFRGTDSLTDGLLDTDLLFQPFVSYSNDKHADVKVEGGFNDVYRSSSGDTASMQQQLFELLDKYLPVGSKSTLYITGHSLGAALSELFTLDVALSRPDINASTINFASPRVGDAKFVDLYMQQPAQQNPATRTLRVQNTYDIVPCVPTEDLGYRSLPNALLLAFYWDASFGEFDKLACHSALNYQAVINCANESATGICENPALFVPGNDYKITSIKPDTSSVCSLWSEDVMELLKKV